MIPPVDYIPFPIALKNFTIIILARAQTVQATTAIDILRIIFFILPPVKI
jgi:hypothetical protein